MMSDPYRTDDMLHPEGNNPQGLDFATPPKVRRGDPETSWAAWILSLPRMPRQRAAIVRSLLQDGPATQDELALRLDMRVNSVSTRISELVKAGYVEDSGTRRRGQRVVRVVK